MDQDSDFLLHIISFAGPTAGADFGVTLLVDGTVVSGTVIGVTEYYDRLVEELAKVLGTTSIGDNLSRELKRLPDRAPKSKNNEPEDGLFIYLRDATIAAPDETLIRIPTWRGRLSRVSGWNLGVPNYIRASEEEAAEAQR